MPSLRQKYFDTHKKLPGNSGTNHSRKKRLDSYEIKCMIPFRTQTLYYLIVAAKFGRTCLVQS